MTIEARSRAAAGARDIADRPAISVDALVKRYRKADRNAVDGISFEVRAGEFFALLGPNGAGKTTTLSILTTTLAPTSGQALIDGLDVVADAAAVRQRVGIIFQRPSLDRNLTGEENVRFHAILYGLYPYAPSWRLMAVGYRRQVEEWSELLELGREIHRPVKTYSGGMLRKLEIVRSLVHRPAVLFLDEPTTGLDAPSRRALWSYLRDVRAANGTTIVLTSHYLEEAEQADRICVIDAGRIVATGSPAELTATLVTGYLEVDADDRTALQAELARRQIAASGDGPFRIPVGTAETHALIRSIETPLSVVRTHAPSLEDAYLQIVSRAELGDEALGRVAEREPNIRDEVAGG
ncbi:MAG: type transport system ATP-binding protein [Chloroflexota bacterium]|jgi:ABC-2 type transport system ATP-binding protein|nr:type transport system ATP-binding protein [Chloroflexota bacterium]